jgi:hypothetical protein
MSVSGVPAAIAQLEQIARPVDVATATAGDVASFNAAIVEAQSKVATMAPADVAQGARGRAISDQLDFALDRIGFLNEAAASMAPAGVGPEPRLEASTLQSGSTSVNQTMASFAEILNASVAATLVVRGTSQLTTTANQLARG